MISARKAGPGGDSMIFARPKPSGIILRIEIEAVGERLLRLVACVRRKGYAESLRPKGQGDPPTRLLGAGTRNEHCEKRSR